MIYQNVNEILQYIACSSVFYHCSLCKGRQGCIVYYVLDKEINSECILIQFIQVALDKILILEINFIIL